MFFNPYKNQNQISQMFSGNPGMMMPPTPQFPTASQNMGSGGAPQLSQMPTGQSGQGGMPDPLTMLKIMQYLKDQKAAPVAALPPPSNTTPPFMPSTNATANLPLQSSGPQNPIDAIKKALGDRLGVSAGKGGALR